MVDVGEVLDGREEAVVEGDFDLADGIDVVVLEAVDATEEAVGGDGYCGSGVGYGGVHGDDCGEEADEEGREVFFALEEEAEQEDGVELDGGGDAEEDGGEDGEASAIGDETEGDDEPEDDLNVGSLDEEDEREGEEQQREEEPGCVAAAEEEERGGEGGDGGERGEEEVGLGGVGGFVEGFVDGCGAGWVGEAGEGPRGEEFGGVVEGEAAFIDDDVFKGWAGGGEDAVV